MRLEILALLDSLQAPGPEPTLPDGPGDIPGYEVPRDLPSKGFDAVTFIGTTFATVIGGVIIIYVLQKIINGIPWKVVGPVILIILVLILIATQ